MKHNWGPAPSFRRTSLLRWIVMAVMILSLTFSLTSLVDHVESAQQAHKPFIMPFAGEPGPETWMLIQPYGNTTFAYRFRNTVYSGGQGLHFGIDLAAPCGTEIIAIGDGVVYSVDSWHGAGPHNLLINHANGYASFYGHLLVRTKWKKGDRVEQGQVVALSGDPDLTCNSRPHLHLEIRNSPDHNIAYNPMDLIEADWDRIALMGGNAFEFQQDLEEPRQWQGFYDQPETRFGYSLLNNFEQPWPLDW